MAICTRGRTALLESALEAVSAAVARADETDILVVEQGGSDAVAIAQRFGARHLADFGSGVSRARNLATEAASGDVVVFTDDDCVVPANWVVDHVAALMDDQVDASFGAVDGLPRDAGADGAASPARHRAGAMPWMIGHASNMAVRREVLRNVGGFDERIGPGSGGVDAAEDAECITRLLDAGYTLVSGTGLPVRHIDWRSAAETDAALRRYEAGAGVWVGSALRARRPHARRYFLARLGMVAHRCRSRLREKQWRTAAQLALAFGYGFVRGLCLRPWERARFTNSRPDPTTP